MTNLPVVAGIIILILIAVIATKGLVGKLGCLLANALQLVSWYLNGQTLSLHFLIIAAGIYLIAVIIQWLLNRKIAMLDAIAIVCTMALTLTLHNSTPPPRGPDGGDDVTINSTNTLSQQAPTGVLPFATATPVMLQSMPTPFRAANLAKNQRHDVYSAPSTSSYRASSSKGTPAYVSTDEWINIYAKEGDWYLVEYELNRDLGNRIGYIHSSNFPVQANAVDLPVNHMPASILRDTSLTDDPNCFARSLFTLSIGSRVNVICMMGGWHYVETHINNQQIRGFIQASNVSID